MPQPADAAAAQSVPVWRGVCVATGVAASLWVVAWVVVSGQAPDAGAVSDAATAAADGAPVTALAMTRFAGLGVLAAAAAAMLAAVAHGRLVNPRRVPAGRAPAGPASAGGGATTASTAGLVAGARVTRALVLGFASKAAALILGITVLALLDVKFELMAAFALSLAAASLLIQLLSAALLDRALSRRRAVASPGPGQDGPRR